MSLLGGISNILAGIQTTVAQASVTVGDVPVDSSDSDFDASTQTVDIFTDYVVNNKFIKDGNTAVMPVASPMGFQGNDVSVIDLAAPTLMWICDWTASKFNEQPEVPSSTAPDGWVLLSDTWEPANLSLAPDGAVPFYRISGTFVYVKLQPSPKTNEDISFPLPPWMGGNGIDRTMPSSKLDPTIAAN